jgi:hypothetical protein
MGRRGRKRQLDVGARYWELVLSGVGTVQACRMVGIGRKTGYRCRAERGGLAPLALSETRRTNRFLSRLERQRIHPARPGPGGTRDRPPHRTLPGHGQPRAAPQPATARPPLRRRPGASPREGTLAPTSSRAPQPRRRAAGCGAGAPAPATLGVPAADGAIDCPADCGVADARRRALAGCGWTRAETRGRQAP